MSLKTCFAVLLSSLMLMSLNAVESVKPVAPNLKQRQPHWRPKIMENYEGGQPQRVLFYEQIGEANEAPVKQLFFYPNGQIKVEMDLALVPEDSKGAKEWKSIIVPHGMSLSYFEGGQVERVCFYDRGVLHGEMKLFFPDGKLHGECSFKQGERHGQMFSYFEEGGKAEEALFEEGIYVIGFAFPVVPKGKARIRVQVSAAHKKEDIEQAVEKFTAVGRRFGALI